MHDGLRLDLAQDRQRARAILQVSLEKLRAQIDSTAMALAQIIEDSDFVALIQKQLRADAADIAGAADDEDFHAAKFGRGRRLSKWNRKAG